MTEAERFDADDRGNVVDFYDGDEIVARLDREAEVDGYRDVTTWDGCGTEVEKWAKVNGWKAAIASAIWLDGAGKVIGWPRGMVRKVPQ